MRNILITAAILGSLILSCDRIPDHSKPRYIINQGQELPAAVQAFEKLRERVCSGKTTLRQEWDGKRERLLSETGSMNHDGGAFSGVSNYSNRCETGLENRQVYEYDNLMYHRNVQHFMVDVYTLSAGKSDTDERLCSAEIEGWTTSYQARAYNKGLPPKILVSSTMNSNVEAACIMNMTSDGLSIDPSWTQREAAICRIHMGMPFDGPEADNLPYNRTIQTVDISLKMGDGKTHIWSMYYVRPKSVFEEPGWRLFEVDKNFCLPLPKWANYRDFVINHFGVSHEETIYGYKPEWLDAFWNVYGMHGNLMPAGDFYEPGDDYTNPERFWYYRVDSPYHKKRW